MPYKYGLSKLIFNEVPNGYNKDSVREFIDIVIQEFENQIQYRKQLEEEIKALYEKTYKIEKFEEVYNKALHTIDEVYKDKIKLAEEKAKVIIDNAKKDAERISKEANYKLEQAEKNANRIISEALFRAKEIEHEVEKISRDLEHIKRQMKQNIDNELALIKYLENRF